MQQNHILAPYLASFLAPIAAPVLSTHFHDPRPQTDMSCIPTGPQISVEPDQTEGQIKIREEMQRFIDQEIKKDRDLRLKSLRIEELEAINSNLGNQFNILKEGFDKLKIENTQQKNEIQRKAVENSTHKDKIKELEEELARKQRTIEKQNDQIGELTTREKERKEKLKIVTPRNRESPKEKSIPSSSSVSSTHVLTEIGLVEREVYNYFPPQMFRYCLKFVKQPVQEVFRIPPTRELFNTSNALLPFEKQRRVYESNDIYQCSKLRHFLKEKQKKELSQNLVIMRVPVFQRPWRRKRSVQECAPSYDDAEQAHTEFQKKFYGRNN